MKTLLCFFVIFDLLAVAILFATVRSPTEWALIGVEQDHLYSRIDYIRQHGNEPPENLDQAKWNRRRAEAEKEGRNTTYGFFAIVAAVNLGIVILMWRIHLSGRREPASDLQ